MKEIVSGPLQKTEVIEPIEIVVKQRQGSYNSSEPGSESSKEVELMNAMVNSESLHNVFLGLPVIDDIDLDSNFKIYDQSMFNFRK
jgi:hypothetical protein